MLVALPAAIYTRTDADTLVQPLLDIDCALFALGSRQGRCRSNLENHHVSLDRVFRRPRLSGGAALQAQTFIDRPEPGRARRRNDDEWRWLRRRMVRHWRGTWNLQGHTARLERRESPGSRLADPIAHVHGACALHDRN